MNVNFLFDKGYVFGRHGMYYVEKTAEQYVLRFQYKPTKEGIQPIDELARANHADIEELKLIAIRHNA